MTAPNSRTGRRRLTAVSLFAGIGGIDLALERAGVQVTAAVEIDPAARGVLARHFPATRLFDDVTKVTADDLRAAGFVPERGIVTAGWPCQGNSVAGRRGGMADPRSGLWVHVTRLLAELRPHWFLGENVPGLLSVNGGKDFATVAGDLAELGMACAWRVLDAQFFGVPQRRRRVLIVGNSGGTGTAPVQILFEPESRSGDSAPRGAARAAVAATSGDGPVSTLQAAGAGRGHRIDAEGAAGGHLIASALTTRCGNAQDDQQTGQLIPFDTGQITSAANYSNPQPGDPCHSLAAQTHPPAIAFHGEQGARRLTPLECERLQGFPDLWTASQSDSTRYRQLGNAVAVPCVEWVVRRIVAVDALERAA